MWSACASLRGLSRPRPQLANLVRRSLASDRPSSDPPLPRVLPAEVPLVLRNKLLGPKPPPPKQRRLPENVKRKRIEKTFARPLDEIVAETPKPFRVIRSKMGNLPVYTDIRNGGSRVVTQLRKYAGDVDALADELQAVTGKTVMRYHGRLEVRGVHHQVVKEWLTRLGF